jgi:DNA-binding transcriptional ArsR family regulator
MYVAHRQGSDDMATALARKPKKPDLDIDDLLKNAQAASEFLKALSHEARLVILCLLIEGEKSVTEIEQLLNLRQPAVSQQLARLRADNLVETRREGKNIYYSLARPEVRQVIEALHAAFCAPGVR